MNSTWKTSSKMMLLPVVVLGVSMAASAQSRSRIYAPQHFFAPLPDEARDLFNAAQKLYDEDKLADAEKRFREVVQRYPKNDIADKADYYLIRTLNQLGKRSEALGRINAFPRAYPRSKWTVDVEEMRVRLTNEVSPFALRGLLPQVVLAASSSPAPPAPPAPPAQPTPAPGTAPGRFGNQQAERNREQLERNREQLERVREQAERIREQADRDRNEPADPEVALQQEIMRAVFRNNPERAIEIAAERLKSNPSDPVVLSNLNTVATSRSPQALPMLLALARSAANVKVRKDAIFWISQSRAEKDTIVDTLVGLLPMLGDEEAESVTFSLGQIRSDKSMNALATIARDKNKAEKTRNNALFWIGQSRVPNRVSLLEDIYKSNMDSSRIRIQVLFSLSQTREPQVVPLLGSIASSDPDIEVRKQAVFWLGQVRGPEASKALENLLQRK